MDLKGGQPIPLGRMKNSCCPILSRAECDYKI